MAIILTICISAVIIVSAIMTVEIIIAITGIEAIDMNFDMDADIDGSQ